MAQPLTFEPADGASPRMRVLLVDDDPASQRVAAAAVAAAGGDAAIAPAGGFAPDALRSAGFAVVDVPDRAALRRIEAFVAAGLSVIATSGAGSVGLAVEAMRRGAADFVLKPFSPDALARRLAPRFAERVERPVPFRHETSADFAGFFGGSAPMRAVYDQIARIAPSRAPVFVTGESGSGKELCAEAIHARSPRAKKAFVALNCGAIPRELMESEIFGHVRGAFTGASEDRAGAAETADGGTLFLDEIGEMELALQAKLLRFLQTGEFRRVGDPRPRHADLRVVCATHRDPFAEVAAGRFRQDLFYRLHVLPIRLPALRERGDDVVALANAFLARFAAEEGRGFRRFAPDALARLATYGWPGNVRELQNAVRRAVVLDDGEEVTLAMLPPELRGEDRATQGEAAGTAVAAAVEPFWVQERRIIEEALAAFGGNLARAAAALEISPSTIYRKRERWAAPDGA